MALGRRGASARHGWFVLAFSALSLLDLQPVRRAEQALVPLLAPCAGAVAWLSPKPPVSADADADLLPLAQPLWQAWCAEVERRPAVPSAGRQRVLLPTRGVDPATGELLLNAADVPLEPGSAVTHRGVLVGFVQASSAHGRHAVAADGTARVRLVGSPNSRPVAAAWLPMDGGDPAWFLVAPGPDGPRIRHRSRELDPSSRPLVATRDVSDFGDRVPAGLLLGRIESVFGDKPGGGVGRALAGDERLVPLISAHDIELVAVELPGTVSVPLPTLSARILLQSADGRLLIDQGSLDGVLSGDLVVQQGRLVGRVSLCGPFSAELTLGAGAGQVLVQLHPDGVASVDPHDVRWPQGGQARPGAAVVLGRPGLGGVLVGRVTEASVDSLSWSAAVFHRDQPVFVVRR